MAIILSNKYNYSKQNLEMLLDKLNATNLQVTDEDSQSVCFIVSNPLNSPDGVMMIFNGEYLEVIGAKKARGSQSDALIVIMSQIEALLTELGVKLIQD
jgi:hypothetical protein